MRDVPAGERYPNERRRLTLQPGDGRPFEVRLTVFQDWPYSGYLVLFHDEDPPGLGRPSANLTIAEMRDIGQALVALADECEAAFEADGRPDNPPSVINPPKMNA